MLNALRGDLAARRSLGLRRTRAVRSGQHRRRELLGRGGHLSGVGGLALRRLLRIVRLLHQARGHEGDAFPAGIDLAHQPAQSRAHVTQCSQYSAGMDALISGQIAGGDSIRHRHRYRGLASDATVNLATQEPHA